MDARIVVAWILIVASTMALAQQSTESAGDSRQLSDQFETNNYYAEKIRLAWRDNADRLQALNQAYGDAKAALSKENVRRVNEIVSQNSEAHKALGDKVLSGAEHAAEFKRIQSESQQSRAELGAWFADAHKQLDIEHAAKRAARIAATQELVERLGEQRIATLQRLINGPVPVGSLPVLALPEESDTSRPVQANTGVIEDSANPQTATGGIDVAGAVPLDSPGDELLAAKVDQDMQRLREQLYRADVERRRQAEEEAAQRDRDMRARFGNRDSDGANDVTDPLDCNDRNAAVNPGQAEVCNYIDDNCDGGVDEGVGSMKYLDRDGDLHGDPASPLYACPQTTRNSEGAGEWLSTYGNDCDDTDPTVWNDCGQ